MSKRPPVERFHSACLSRTASLRAVYTLWSLDQPLVQPLEVCLHSMTVGPTVGPTGWSNRLEVCLHFVTVWQTVGPIVLTLSTLYDSWSNRCSNRLDRLCKIDKSHASTHTWLNDINEWRSQVCWRVAYSLKAGYFSKTNVEINGFRRRFFIIKCCCRGSCYYN